jgi:hypothetical protein
MIAMLSVDHHPHHVIQHPLFDIIAVTAKLDKLGDVRKSECRFRRPESGAIREFRLGAKLEMRIALGGRMNRIGG